MSRSSDAGERGRRRARSSTYLSLDELFRLTGLHLDHLDEPAPSAALKQSEVSWGVRRERKAGRR